ncbi:MAG: hypothetical protein J7501_16775, partial [Bdellovibrio sp.]|nr:hypothetical protein [Bdellovibrio sp.]
MLKTLILLTSLVLANAAFAVEFPPGVKDINGCIVPQMYSLEWTRTFEWKGECENGWASGEGKLIVSDSAAPSMYVIGTIQGNRFVGKSFDTFVLSSRISITVYLNKSVPFCISMDEPGMETYYRAPGEYGYASEYPCSSEALDYIKGPAKSSYSSGSDNLGKGRRRVVVPVGTNKADIKTAEGASEEHESSAIDSKNSSGQSKSKTREDEDPTKAKFTGLGICSKFMNYGSGINSDWKILKNICGRLIGVYACVVSEGQPESKCDDQNGYGYIG